MKPVLKNERGIALFLVLWVMALLTVIAAEFCQSVGTEVDIVRNFKEETEAYYIASAGVSWIIGELVTNQYLSYPGNPGGDDDLPEAPRWRLSCEMPPIPFGKGMFKIKKENESGKVNLNRADRSLLKIMLNGFEIEAADKDVIVDSIMDWRDENSLTRANGAEDDYYQSLPEPYRCKNGDFTTIEELLLVKGVTPGIFYGGLKDMVSVYQDENKPSTKGKRRKTETDFNKININAAPAQMLRSLPGMTAEIAEEIMSYREKKDFRSPSELFDLVGSDVYRAIAPFTTLAPSSYFTIYSTGLLEGSRNRQGVRAVVKIDRRLGKGYEIIQWIDGLEYQS